MVGSGQYFFSSAQRNDTIFFSALIGGCLTNVQAADDIRARIARYLLRHSSEQTTWGYWERGSTSRPYPDDLDDTACAVASIANYDRRLLKPKMLAGLAASLMHCEVDPGGPYRTWLVEAGAEEPKWYDVDVAVNANIGYMFHALGIASPKLEAYVDACILANKLQSPYYIGTLPTLYFLARWYKGEQLPRLQELIMQALRTARGPLHKAMALSAAYHSGFSIDSGDQLVIDLLEHQVAGAWPAVGLYYEPPQNKQWRYAGSPELTTAFVLEAFSCWLTHSQTTLVSSTPTDFNGLYKEALASIKRSDVTNIANVMAQALAYNIPLSLSKTLNSASLHGWLAYGIYDDMVDGECDAKMVGVANYCLRISVDQFTAALPNNKSFRRFIEKTFTAMDSANTWEVMNARNLLKPPDYGDYSLLAQRSWGHVLAPTAVLLAAGYKLHSSEITNFHKFMHHYIIARQLSDDAHDWADDWAHERVTPVVAMLLNECSDAELIDLQQHFWTSTIDTVNCKIRHHLCRAQGYLDACSYITERAPLQAWLQMVEQSCVRAEAGRADTQDFIRSFRDMKTTKKGKYSTCSIPDRIVYYNHE